jgi:hypothetical protein
LEPATRAEAGNKAFMPTDGITLSKNSRLDSMGGNPYAFPALPKRTIQSSTTR